MNKKTTRLSLLLSLLLITTLSFGILSACSNANTSSTASLSSSSKSSSLVSSSKSSSTESASSTSSATSSSSSISQTDMINLLAAWIENSQGMYEVQYFSDSTANTTYIFVNGGQNGTGKDYYGNSPAGIALKSEQNSAQFVVKGDQVTFQTPSFPNGLTGKWSEIVWETKATMSLSQLQSQFSSQTTASSKQIIKVTASSPY